MKFYLQKNWAEQFAYGDDTPGFFVGRTQEVKSLVSAIKNNDSSTILVSSVRGVGKTSFVHKALSDIKDEIIPFFVNIGHTLSIDDVEKKKKKILVSIIRHAYLADSSDKQIEQLYFDCIGKTTEEIKEVSEDSISSKNTQLLKFKPDIKILVALVGVFLVGVGVSVQPIWARSVFAFLGLGFLSVSFSSEWEKMSKKFHSFGKKKIIDDSTDYLEIKFEAWLREKSKEKKKKLVFVIDELDKIDTEEAFGYIKEYKNLFTRSQAHFIFISSQEAFELTQKDRSLSIKDGGIFPTFFTHVYYLSLPSSDDIKAYLNNILVTDPSINDERGKNILTDYLLFVSGNDFFELKRVVNDTVIFDESGDAYIDIDEIKKDDSFFDRKATLFEWVKKWFLDKNWSILKSNWKNNSELQKSTLSFLKETYPNNFYKSSIAGDPILSRFADFLLNIGHYSERDFTIDDAEGDGDILNDAQQSGNKVYYCTNIYNRDSSSTLTPEDKAFQDSFKRLVKIANDLDDIPEVYLGKNEFSDDYENVNDGRDGKNLSGISLFSVYKDFKDIFEKLEDTSARISVKVEKVKSAKKIIDEQIENVNAEYFDILNKLIGATLKDKSILGKYPTNSSEANIQGAFSVLPGFLADIPPNVYDASIWCNLEKGRYVLLIRYFEDEKHVTRTLEALRSNKNILVVNVMNAEKFEITKPTVHKDSAGRTRKKGLVVDNYINFNFSDFRQLVDLVSLVEKHLN